MLSQTQLNWFYDTLMRCDMKFGETVTSHLNHSGNHAFWIFNCNLSNITSNLPSKFSDTMAFSPFWSWAHLPGLSLEDLEVILSHTRITGHKVHQQTLQLTGNWKPRNSHTKGINQTGKDKYHVISLHVIQKSICKELIYKWNRPTDIENTYSYQREKRKG